MSFNPPDPTHHFIFCYQHNDFPLIEGQQGGGVKNKKPLGIGTKRL
jgi:hypothetical protein